MAKRKVTPFARFLLAMIIIVPLAFAGASYINGEDPIRNFKELTGMESSAQPAKADKPKTTSQPKPSDKQQASPSKGESLSAENARLKKELEKRDRAIKDLQEQLKKCQ